MPTPKAGKIYSLFSILKRASTIQVAFGLLLSTLLIFTTTGYASTESWVNSVRTSVMALDSARTTAVNEMQGQSLTTQEAADYRDFVLYLNTRIFTYCQELTEQASPAALEGLPCPNATGQALAPGEADQEGEVEVQLPYPPVAMGTAQTEAEQTKQLNDQFLASLGSFDDMLLKEEEKVSSRVPRQRESGLAGMADEGAESAGGGSPGPEGSGESGSADEQGTEPGEGSEGAEGETGDETGEAGERGAPGAGRGETTEQTKGGVPQGKLPPPEDDDIVARQLREAAEKETDPELKKKLWEEYWKYKGVTPKSG